LQQTIDQLEQHRSELYGELAKTGDFRRGNVAENFRRCGKKGCACADPDRPGHGPRHLLTRSVEGKTKSTHLRPGSELEKAQQEVGNYRRFRSLVDEIVDINEQICDERPVPNIGNTSAVADGQKKGSKRRSRRSSTKR
jgi:hypothetical protein